MTFFKTLLMLPVLALGACMSTPTPAARDYGTSPAPARLASVRAPVLGLYGADDARVNTTVPPADSTMKALAKPYRPIFYEGAGHGFLRQQDGREGKNLAAARAAWPETIAWFRIHLGR